MNKIIKKLMLVASVVCVLVLTACDDGYEKPTIEVTDTNPLRTTIGIDFTIWDIDNQLVDLKVTLTGEHDGEKYTDTKTVTITGGKYDTDNEDNGGEGEGKFIGEQETLTFSNLELDHTYTISMTGTYDEKSRNMLKDKIQLTTSNKGSESDPHKISTFDDLNDVVRKDTDGFFVLQNNIDCKDENGKAREIKPFFSSSRKFVGNFKGNGFTISNFFQDSYDQDLGLFGYIGDKGVVDNLNINNVEINSSRYTNLYAGAFAGTNYGTITNIKMNNITITTKGPDDGNQFVGGFVGQNKETGNIDNVTIDNVTLKLNVPSNGRIGGFVGTNESTTKVAKITNSIVKNAFIEVQIPVDPAYTADDENVEIVLSVGGYAGDNRGYIEGATTDADIAIYVENNALDAACNPEDFEGEGENTGTNKVQDAQRHNSITQYDLNVGGFVGANLSGSIIESKTSTKKIEINVPYVDLFRLGGFVGYNDYFAGLAAVEMNAGTYDLVLGEDTIYNGSDNENVSTTNAKYIGTVAGIQNNPTLSNINVTVLNGTGTFTLKIRYATYVGEETRDADKEEDKDETPKVEWEYRWEAVSSFVNDKLLNN